MAKKGAKKKGAKKKGAKKIDSPSEDQEWQSIDEESVSAHASDGSDDKTQTDGASQDNKSEEENNSDGSSEENNSEENNSDGKDSKSDDEIITNETISFQSQFSLTKLLTVIAGLTKPQKKLLKECGFGSILDLKCNCTSGPYKHVIVWLTKHFDMNTHTFNIPGTRAFKIDSWIVHCVLGIPHGGRKIKPKASPQLKALIAEETTPGPLAPRIQVLIQMITPELVGDRFVRVFILLLLSIFLCPTSASRASHTYYDGICSVKNINSYDWCDAVASCLNNGIVKFKQSLSKKSNEKPTLSGCIFVLLAAYFDYLESDNIVKQKVPDTLPRIAVWDDVLLENYMAHFPKFKSMKIKSLESTVFGKAPLNWKNKRGCSFDDLGNEAAACGADVAGCSSPHMPSKKLKKVKEVPSPPLPHGSLHINLDSVQRVFPERSHSDFSVWCGEELHPLVEQHINDVTASQSNNEMIVALRRLCLSSSREKFMEYIQSAQPMLISHCFSLVTSFMSGAQLGSVQKLPASPSMGIQADTSRSQHAHSVGHISVQSNNCPEKNNDTEIRDASGSKENGSTVNVKTIPAASIHHDSDGGGGAAASKNKIITEKDKKQGDDKRASVDCIEQLHDGGPLAAAIKQKKASSNANVAACMLLDAKGGESNDDDTSIACGEDKKNLLLRKNCQHLVDKKKSLAQKELSALGHKKRALKQPSSVFQNPTCSKVTVTEFEKDLFHIGTKRPIGLAQSNICVDIGRFFIEHGQFSNSMAGTRWVGTFAMNVFAEALNYDMKNSVEPLSVKKCYLTSSEVDHLIIDDIDINLLANKLDPEILGFNIAEMDMVFIPICYEDHWWLVVANLRDDRFDILNSMKSDASNNKITSIVCANITRLFDTKGLRGDDVIDLKDFSKQAQTVPQQKTSNDCGIYVMHFMRTWDGRQIPPIRPEDVYNLRVKFAAYMLTHRGNKKVLRDIKKLVEKEACGQKKKEKRI